MLFIKNRSIYLSYIFFTEMSNKISIVIHLCFKPQGSLQLHRHFKTNNKMHHTIQIRTHAEKKILSQAKNLLSNI